MCLGHKYYCIIVTHSILYNSMLSRFGVQVQGWARPWIPLYSSSLYILHPIAEVGSVLHRGSLQTYSMVLASERKSLTRLRSRVLA